MIIKVISRSRSFEVEVIPESNCKCLDFYPEAGDWLSTQMHSCSVCDDGRVCLSFQFLNFVPTLVTTFVMDERDLFDLNTCRILNRVEKLFSPNLEKTSCDHIHRNYMYSIDLQTKFIHICFSINKLQFPTQKNKCNYFLY